MLSKEVEMSEYSVPVKMAHMVLKTANIVRLAQWYQSVLGCAVVHEMTGAQHMIFLTFDAEDHRIGIAELDQETPRPSDATGLAHVAYSYGSFDDFFTTYERLEASDIRPLRCVNHRMSTSFYYADPDGNGVELFTDNPGTEAEPKAAFDLTTVQFDPAELLRRCRSGANADALAAP
jgi:catechol-2,3-dioxygenase